MAQHTAPSLIRQHQSAPLEQPAMLIPHFLETLLDRPIAYHRVFADLTKSVKAALMLSQALYWSKRTRDPDGWFYKPQHEWFTETGLTRREQDTARVALLGCQADNLPTFWQEQRRGLPARIYYRLDCKALMQHLERLHQQIVSNLKNAPKRQTDDGVQPALTEMSAKSNAPKRQTELRKSAKLDATKAPIKSAQKRPTSLRKSAKHSLQRLQHDTTSKTTTISSTRARAQQKPMKIFPAVRQLYCSLTGNAWRAHDEKAARSFTNADPRKIELAIIETMLQTEQLKIHSFGYFVPRLQQWLSTDLADESINTVLQMRRQTWQQRRENPQ